MADANATKEVYIDATVNEGKEINYEIIHLLSQGGREEEIENTGEFVLRLHGNKRNDENEIYRKKVNDTDLIVLCHLLAGSSFITGIDLGYNSICDDGAVLLSKLLNDTCVLKHLVLSYNNITTKGAKALAYGIQINETLVQLKIDGNNIGPAGGMAIASALQVNHTLRELNLNNTEQDTQSIIAFTTVLKVNNSLKILHLDRALLHSNQEETTVHIARMLEVNNSMEELHLRYHGIQDFGAERVVEHIIANTTLLHLDLSCNKIARDGVKCIAEYLRHNPPLQVLNLSYNRVEDAGAVWLSEALVSGNISLMTLALCGASLTSEGLCAIAKSLLVNTTLRQLYVWGNKTDATSCQAFLEMTSGDRPRFSESDTDVKAYIVDGVPCLARLSSPY